jgi:hypothetical protein
MCPYLLNHPLIQPCLNPRQYTSLHSPLDKQFPYLCLCFGFLLQIIYTYLPFFRLTLLHPSHSFLTELRTFMPRVCCAGVCRRSPLKRAARSVSGCCACVCARSWCRLGRKSVLHAHVGVWMWRARWARRVVGKRVRRSGKRSERGSILGGVLVGTFTGCGSLNGGWVW